MPVFDFSDKPVKNEDTVCTYTAFQSNAKEKTPEEPILVLDNSERQWIHHALGVFTNPAKRTTFEFKENGETFSADILKIDSRFVSLIKWLGENHISVRLSGKNLEGRICSIQNPRDSIWWRNQVICGRWILTVYDRTTACKYSIRGSRGG